MIPCMVLYNAVFSKIRSPAPFVRLVLSVYAGISLLFALLLWREETENWYLGWCFHAFADFYHPVIMSTVSSFMCTTTTPQQAAREFGIFFLIARFGAVAMSYIGNLFLQSYSHVPFKAISVLTLGISISVFLCTLCVSFLALFVKEESSFTPAQKIGDKNDSEKQERLGVAAIFCHVIKNPYTASMLLSVSLSEILSNIAEYHLGVHVTGSDTTAAGIGNYLFLYNGLSQSIGTVLGYTSTYALRARIPYPYLLALTPLMVGLCFFSLFLQSHSILFLIISIATMRSVIHGFDVPVRKMLYIPTSAEVQFSARSFIESVGSSFAKCCAAGIAYFGYATLVAHPLIIPAFGGVLSLMWGRVTYLLGGMYQRVVDSQETIHLSFRGEKKEETKVVPAHLSEEIPTERPLSRPPKNQVRYHTKY